MGYKIYTQNDVPVIVIVVHCIEAGWYRKMAALMLTLSFSTWFLSIRYSFSLTHMFLFRLGDWIRDTQQQPAESRNEIDKRKSQTRSRWSATINSHAKSFYVFIWPGQVLLLPLNGSPAAAHQRDLAGRVPRLVFSLYSPVRIIIAYTIIASFSSIIMLKIIQLLGAACQESMVFMINE